MQEAITQNLPPAGGDQPLPSTHIRQVSISHLQDLPDDALITVKSFAALIDTSVSTIWRRASNEPATFPQPIRLGKRCTRWRMGDVRAFIGEAAQ